VTAASQKRGSSLDEGSTDMPGPDHAPSPSPDLTGLSQIPYADSPTPDHAPDHAPAPSPDLADILSEIPHANSPPPTPGYAPTPSPDLTDILAWYANIPSTSTSESDHGLDHSPVPSPDLAGKSPYADSIPPTPGYAPAPSPDLTNILSWSGNSLPSTPTPDHGLDHVPAPSPDLAGILPYADSTPPTPGYAPDHAPAPSPDLTNILSWYGNSPTPDYGLDHVPAPSPDLADILSEIPQADSTPPTGSRGNHQTPPQSPGVDSGTHSLLNPAEPFPSEFDIWDKVFKGKFKRRISGSDAVNLAQKDTRSRIF
jgi:hypothetical protein